MWSGEAGKLEASFNQFISTTLQGEHDADLERVSQRSHQEREKYGDDSGSAVIEDLSEYGHGLDLVDEDSEQDNGAFDDDVSFVSAMAAIPPPGPRDHLTWAPGIHGGNDNLSQPWNTPVGDNATLVIALRSLERTLQTHCKLLNRRIKKDKSNSTSSSSPSHQHGYHQKDQKSRSPVLSKAQSQSEVSSSTSPFTSSTYMQCIGTQQCHYSIFRNCSVGLQVVLQSRAKFIFAPSPSASQLYIFIITIQLGCFAGISFLCVLLTT